MASITDPAEEELLNDFYNVAPLTFPAPWKLGIGGAWNAETGAQTSAEPGAGSYARADIAWQAAVGPVLGPGGFTTLVYADSEEVVFPGPTTTWGIGATTNAAMFPSGSGGLARAVWASVSVSGAAGASTEIRFPAGAFRVYVDHIESGGSIGGVLNTASTYEHRKKMLDLYLRGDAYDPDLHFGMLTGAVGPDNAIPGTYSEMTLAGYARQDGNAVWDAAAPTGAGSHRCGLNTNIVFGPAGVAWNAAAGEPNGVTRWVLFDSASGGNWIFVQLVSLPGVNAGDNAIIDAASLYGHLW